MNELHLFAGAGGGILGGMLLGHTTVCDVEIEPYCQQVLLQRQRDGILPRFPIWDDITTFSGTPWRGHVDVVCGGFPCQDISIAGKGDGIDGERSGLWSEMARVIREVGPRYVFVENSPALTSRGLDRVLGDLAEMGFDAEWGCLSAEDAIWIDGTPEADHIRERIWILGFDANANSTQRKGGGIPSRVHAEHANARRDGWWQTEPGMGRVANGMAHQSKRLKAIGNGQVPRVAALAWSTLSRRLTP